MSYDPYRAQKETKNRNRHAILKALTASPQRFTDLLEITKLSHAGLDKILKGMVNEKLIKQNPHDKIYSVTNNGEESLASADISYITSRIRNDDGMYYHNYSDTLQSIMSRRIKGAIRPFLYIDKNLDELNLLTTSDVKQIEDLIYKKLSNSIKKKKLIEKHTGDIVLGFVIDYLKTENIIKKKEKKQK